MRNKLFFSQNHSIFPVFFSESMHNKSDILVFSRKETVEPKSGTNRISPQEAQNRQQKFDMYKTIKIIIEYNKARVKGCGSSGLHCLRSHQ